MLISTLRASGKRFLVAAVAFAAVTVIAHAQTRSSTDASPVFDVASVKPSVPGSVAGGRRGGPGGAGCPQSFNMDRGRVDIRCANVANLIAYAYRLPSRVTRPTGPDWIAGPQAPKFDIQATFPPGLSESQVPEMLQALLADRFKLTVHRVTTEQQVYALVVAKGGLKVKDAAKQDDSADAAAPDTNAPSTIVAIGGLPTRMTRGASGYTIGNPRIGTVRHTDGPNRTSGWEAPSTTLAGLADLLAQMGPLSADVIDMTGVKGRYSVNLEISLNDSVAALAMPPDARDDRSAMESAVMEMENSVVRAMNGELLKLGLQLDRRKGPVETLAVDHVEKPSGN
jgi:uncharacterized protein (TIGR03435 family)